MPGSTTWLVVELNDIHVDEIDGHSRIGEDEVCLFGIVADDAIDGVVGGVGNGGSNDLDASTLQQVEHAVDGTRLVFEKYRELLHEMIYEFKDLQFTDYSYVNNNTLRCTLYFVLRTVF